MCALCWSAAGATNERRAARWADRGFLYVDVAEEPIVRLEPLSGDQYGLSFHHHTGRWERTPFTGDLLRLATVLTTDFGAYLDSYDFPPTKSGPDH